MIVINTGTAENAKDGEKLRIAFSQVNSNFQELTNRLPDNKTVSTLPPSGIPVDGEEWIIIKN